MKAIMLSMRNRIRFRQRKSLGRKVNKKLNTAMVDKLFIGLIVVIIGISCYNAWRFLA